MKCTACDGYYSGHHRKDAVALCSTFMSACLEKFQRWTKTRPAELGPERHRLTEWLEYQKREGALIHASMRAIEKLRWPHSSKGVKYVSNIGQTACGFEPTKHIEWFRAEDAAAMLKNEKISTVLRPLEEMIYVSIGELERPTRKIQRKWRLPTCQTCAVKVDWAQENPFVLHMCAPSYNSKLECYAVCDGSKIPEDTPHQCRANVDMFLPTCEACLDALRKHEKEDRRLSYGIEGSVDWLPIKP